jgi:hypothetical protein
VLQYPAQVPILRTFTFDRNTLKGTAFASAEAARTHIELAITRPPEFTKAESNIIGALRNYMGVLRKRDDGGLELTAVGAAFNRIYAKNPEDAWQWLLTRSLWRYVVPNGTSAAVNTQAKTAGVTFNFFRTLMQLTVALASQPNERRFIYYDELVPILADDANWGLDGVQLFDRIVEAREAGDWKSVNAREGLLDSLEPAYEIPRDNLNTVLNKALRQTGLFEHVKLGQIDIGISVSPRLDPVLQRRVRHVLDHEVAWTP